MSATRTFFFFLLTDLSCHILRNWVGKLFQHIELTQYSEIMHIRNWTTHIQTWDYFMHWLCCSTFSQDLNGFIRKLGVRSLHWNNVSDWKTTQPSYHLQLKAHVEISVIVSEGVWVDDCTIHKVMEMLNSTEQRHALKKNSLYSHF